MLSLDDIVDIYASMFSNIDAAVVKTVVYEYENDDPQFILEVLFEMSSTTPIKNTSLADILDDLTPQEETLEKFKYTGMAISPKESTKMSLMKRIRSKKNVVDSVKFQKFDDSESL